MRRAGFTLIEVLIVVGIIVIMLATSVMSVASGRGAVRAKEATRGVIQMSRYASALALLRQRPVVVTYHHDGRIEVRISGEATGREGIGTASDPIYREVDGEDTLTAAEYAAADDEEPAAKSRTTRKSTMSSTKSGKKAATVQTKDVATKSTVSEEDGFFYTRRVLDPDVLAKEDTEGKYDGVTFTVEVLGEDGMPLDAGLAAARSLRQPERKAKVSEDGTEEDETEEDEPPVSVTYETNGNVNPYRVTVRLEGESETSDGFTISISRSGKATVGDEDENGGRHAGRRRRR